MEAKMPESKGRSTTLIGIKTPGSRDGGYSKKWKNDKIWANAQREHLLILAQQNGHKGGKAGLNKRWWHNEKIGQTTRSKTKPGPEWRLGRAPLSAESKLKHSQAQLGMLFWNNGRVSIRAKDCPGDGWVRGRLPHKE